MIQIKKLLDKVSQFSRNGEYKNALTLCADVIDQYPNDSRGYRQRAYVYARMKKHNVAIDELNKAISLDAGQPDYYFTRGRWFLELGNPSNACKDFTTVLDIECNFDRKYYSESAFFYRAEAHLGLKRFDDALSDCKQVRDGFRVYVNRRIRTKEDVEREANSRF